MDTPDHPSYHGYHVDIYSSPLFQFKSVDTDLLITAFHNGFQMIIRHLCHFFV
uniref:Uncharacterized protein n=1 Tax=Anguilla anguilla TaxID=7936 RepID=A0A0E9SA25_ANGAN